MLEREDLSVLTAEYALGLLSGEEEREIARRLKDDRAMQDELMFWESRLIDLMPVLEVAPPPRVLAELKARLFDDAPQTRRTSVAAPDSRRTVVAVAVAKVAVILALIWFLFLR